MTKEEQSPLDQVMQARAENTDDMRKSALQKIRDRGALTARERIDLLLDEGSFVEYGLLAASVNPNLNAPADGIVIGFGKINEKTAAVLSYDYSVFAGSQGDIGHGKQARLFSLVEKLQCPLVMLLEGAGARAQEIAHMRSGGNDDFIRLPRLVGRVPIVSVVFGRTFAGQGIQAAMSDMVVATSNACLGVAGPPLVESAFGQKLTPEEIGPAKLHYQKGVIDRIADSDEEAIAIARDYLDLIASDTRPFEEEITAMPELRDIVPPNPRMAYDVGKVIRQILDTETGFEMKAGFANNVMTVLGRLGGRTIGIVANQPGVFAGTIDSPAANKMERFIRLCSRSRVPLLFLVDSPGFLIGPDAEKQSVVLHGSQCVIALAQANVPILQVVLRKSYGMSSLVMGNRMWGAVLSVAWPTAEFGVMGLEGAGKIVSGGDKATADAAVAGLKERGTALGMGRQFEFDDVIDPAETRRLLHRTLQLLPGQEEMHDLR